MSGQIHVWYHAQCDDGFGAAWAAWKYFQAHNPGKKVVYTPVFYGKPHPEFQKEDIIYIVDFSYPKQIITDIYSKCKSLMILDHHKSAQEELKGISYCTFDMERSGAAITWSFFHPGYVPTLLKYVQDNDLWRHKLPYCKEVVRYIRSFPYTFEEWDKLCDDFEYKIKDVIERAQAIEKFFQAQVEFNAQWSGLFNFCGLEIPFVNANKTFASEICQLLMTRYNMNAACAYVNRADGTVELSLRSKDDVDVSLFCSHIKELGIARSGGGHKYAAGCIVETKLFYSQLKLIQKEAA